MVLLGEERLYFPFSVDYFNWWSRHWIRDDTATFLSLNILSLLEHVFYRLEYCASRFLYQLNKESGHKHNHRAVNKLLTVKCPSFVSKSKCTYLHTCSTVALSLGFRRRPFIIWAVYYGMLKCGSLTYASHFLQQTSAIYTFI